MKKVLGIAVLMAFGVFSSAFASLWETNCASCHNGKIAPTKETLLKKYPTPEDFLNAVREAVISGKMQRGLRYRLVIKELYGRFPRAFGRFRRLLTNAKVEGEVLKVEKVQGLGRRKVPWWTVDIETENGTVKAWLIPAWRCPSVNLRKGDRVSVVGFIPPYWKVAGIKGIMACLVKNQTTGELIDLSFKPPCRRIKAEGKR